MRSRPHPLRSELGHVAAWEGVAAHAAAGAVRGLEDGDGGACGRQLQGCREARKARAHNNDAVALPEAAGVAEEGLRVALGDGRVAHACFFY